VKARANRWKLESSPNHFLASNIDKIVAFGAFHGISRQFPWTSALDDWATPIGAGT
jgi:hypothetical protein